MNTKLMMSYEHGVTKPRWILWLRTMHKGELVKDEGHTWHGSQIEAIDEARRQQFIPPMSWQQTEGGDQWVGPRIKTSEGRR